MAEDFLALDYVIIGVWTKNLLHPNRPAPHSYQELKTQFLAAGATLKSEVGAHIRTTDQTAATPVDELGYSFWRAGDDTLLLREDGLMLLTGLAEPLTEVLRASVEKLSERHERQTISLAPTPPRTNAAEVLVERLRTVLEPLDRGAFENARLWTSVDHQHDAHNIRQRYFKKVGVDIPDKEEEKPNKKESASA